MYEKFFGLAERPFDLTANPRFLFLTPGHREALGNLEYAISARMGVTLLVGEAGLGKTTLIKATVDAGGRRSRDLAYLSNPTLTRAEFLEFLVESFGLSAQAALSKTTLLCELEEMLLERRDGGVTPALIIDEAQALSFELLEEVRLLANLETPDEKLIPIVLAGQPELAQRLNQAELRQLKQRVGLRCELHPFTLNETAAYIASRIRIAGGDAARLFTREAVILVHDYARGIPRTIGVVCHNALIGGFAMGRSPVGTDIVREVCADFDITPQDPPWASAAAAHQEPAQAQAADSEVTAAAVGGVGGRTELFAAISGLRRRAFL